MIRKLIGSVIFVLIGAGAMYWALSHHIVRTADETVVVPKAALGLADTYVDVTDWTADNFKEHPDLTRALVDNEHGDLIVEAAGQKILDAIKTKADEWFKSDK
jgi:hypothetical protein